MGRANRRGRRSRRDVPNSTTYRSRYLKSQNTLFLLNRTSRREGTLKRTESTRLETAPRIANSFIFNFFFLLFLFLLVFPFLFRLVISVRRSRVRGCGIECVFVAFLHVGRRAGQSCPALHSCEGPDGLHCADGKGACVGFVRRWGCEEIGGRRGERTGD